MFASYTPNAFIYTPIMYQIIIIITIIGNNNNMFRKGNELPDISEYCWKLFYRKKRMQWRPKRSILQHNPGRVRNWNKSLDCLRNRQQSMLFKFVLVVSIFYFEEQLWVKHNVVHFLLHGVKFLDIIIAQIWAKIPEILTPKRGRHYYCNRLYITRTR